jgi:hypothetical protein
MDALCQLSYEGMRLAVKTMERVKGIEPSQSAWEADVLPLNYTRKSSIATGELYYNIYAH